MRPIYVTKPTLPPLYSYIPCLMRIWSTSLLSNNAYYAKKFEKALLSYTQANQVSLVCNATLGLISALSTLPARSKVLTTAFTFPATIQAICLLGLEPVFCDIDSDSPNINPESIFANYTSDCSAILATHCYGIPCNVDAISALAEDFGLTVIYDAAPALLSKVHNKPVVFYGDYSVVSFHATKQLCAAEGGAVFTQTKDQLEHLNLFRNFGIVDEDNVSGIGINAKMSELSAALGFLSLRDLEVNNAKNKSLYHRYVRQLVEIPGLSFFEQKDGFQQSYAYMPIKILPTKSVTRNFVQSSLKHKFNVFARKYYFPLLSDVSVFSAYRACNLGNATALSSQILCLPLYPSMSPRMVDYIVKSLRTVLSC